ncbi:hypothetical protein L917_19352 [Phytophthora nicotianae]|uniref:Uncharacterized protein n=3 Tax=Phytophthora nicotianae TaxID=4792 RepID=V9E228_PHYNI|nr:hypothetical protein F443_20163 [Phytophthora nicotianae P1569]ETK73455.1 hypothetical protein L915_19615 [Phytophthora nicotianae]ETO61863.1 hypothetical protein F444_20174 [Phytophthora nicotianae P1976]ETL26886.1 hypothetical protein L916_19505 [Phytophthora nicotianae]ETL80126.1 hypothetical protein L917_19352 [Phytophthora nicotianae]
MSSRFMDISPTPRFCVNMGKTDFLHRTSCYHRHKHPLDAMISQENAQGHMNTAPPRGTPITRKLDGDAV